MRAVVQRVSTASVRVGGETVGAIGLGLAVLAGVTHQDTAEDVSAMAAKLLALRIFADDEGRMNRSVVDVGGALLVVSQFTLYADASRGNRPGFTEAAPAEQAEHLIDAFVDRLEDADIEVATGRFGAAMEVDLVNDGPVTIILESVGGRIR